MRVKGYLQTGVLAVFAIVAAGCGASMITETTAGFVEQSVETTSTESRESLAEGEAGPARESSKQQEPGTTIAGTTTTTLLALQYSPAWIEYQALELYYEDVSLENTKAIYNYMSRNPNDISTPMGALCWAFHELAHSSMIVVMRGFLDDYLIPDLMAEYGITSEQIGNPGPEATEAFLGLVSRDDESDEDYLEYLRLSHEFAGAGTAWSDAVRAIASPEMSAAFQAGEGLPPDVQVYADALGVFAGERVGREFDREFDPSAESDDFDFVNPSFPGLAAFMEEAKYHQDCKRAMIDDSIGTVDSSSISTTTTITIPPDVSTTTTQPAMEEPLPSATSSAAPPSVAATHPSNREYSPAWIEYQDVQRRYDSDDLEDNQYLFE